MKLSAVFISLAIAATSVSAAPAKRDVDPALIPNLGATAGKNPDGTGNCDGAVNGANGQPVKVPCACPPDAASFAKALNANVAAGKAVNNPSVPFSFPTDNSAASQAARVEASLVTLQNLNGPGQGCPAASTTLSSQLSAAQAGKAAPAPAPAGNAAAAAPAPAAPAPAAPAPAASGGVSAALIPNLGATAGKNPDGTGNCDGAVNGANGQPVKVPCACPPDAASFAKSLNANVAAGKAVNNPAVPFSFPTDNSAASQVARIQSSLVTLQNLNGPGQGCPAASTTLSAQLSAAQAAQKRELGFSPVKRDVPANLIPNLGATAGKNPDGTGNCDGAVNAASGAPVKVPCACPPDAATFATALNKNVAAGHAVNNPSIAVAFPTGSDNNSQAQRIQASLVTLQNLNGPGQGCPAASTTLSSQLAAVQRKRSEIVPEKRDVNPAQIPSLGATAGKNPDGTGNCDGAVNAANGAPVKVPCACPPDQATFTSALNANVAAGHAVNNPSIAVSFPSGSDNNSQAQRIQASLVTLQNLHGPGQGCPAASTTLSAQLAAVQ